MKKPCNLNLQLIVFCLGIFAAGHFAEAARYKDFAIALVQSLPPGAQFRPDLEATLSEYANAYRAQQGKAPLNPSNEFLIPARAHAVDMMLHNFLGHKASTGHDFDSRMRVFVDDITRYPNMAENAARDSQNTPVDKAKARRVLQQWIDSPPHHKTLISRDYAFISTAVVQRGQKIWAVQIFWAKPREKGLFQ
jgi:uncharacterized protein YkwD